jgi:hypothetical protein
MVTLLFVCPALIGYAAVSHSPVAEVGATNTPTQNITFVTTQGAATGHSAGVYAMNTTSKSIIWSYTDCPQKCFDVDQVTNDTVLFVAKTSDHKPWEIGTNASYNWKAIHMNWRTGEVIRRFSVPIETHDVDYLGGDKYIVANKIKNNDAEEEWVEEAKERGWIDESRRNHSHLVYIYDTSTDEITWEYRFSEHFPSDAGDGYENDYTHLNDVDVVRNGSAILMSPREFDRVLLVDKSTKETVWSLGEEDEYSTLHEQHNPVLLSSSPPMVLVADSENDRVVEYVRKSGTWNQSWIYTNGLRWPRDADRLPNGNTLIVDTGNQRVIEVTPEREVVWERRIPKAPYDVERLPYGDEPQGPPIDSLDNVSEATNDTQDRNAVSKISDFW